MRERSGELKKVLILTNTIAPYRIPVLNNFGQDKNYDLFVWYLEEKEKNRKWALDYHEIKYKYECLKGFHTYVQKMDMGVHFNPGLFLKLLKLNPDIIVTSGYDALGYWTALLYSRLFNKKYVVWWGSTLQSSRIKNKNVNKIRRYFFSKVDSFLTYGSDATDCLLHYGVDSKNISTGYNTVDIKYFYKSRKNQIQEYKNNTIQFLFIGQLIKRKGINEIINALEEIRDENWHLTIVGSGPEERALKEKIRKSSIEKKVTFKGYQQKNEVLKLLNESDCLIFPSLIEVWGLVVNEAIATNTFVLASIYAGASRDTIISKVNGLKFDPLNVKDTVESLNWVINNIDYVRSKKTLPLGLWKKIHPYTYSKALKLAIKKANS